VRQQVHQFPITLLCRVLGISRSGFYAWHRRAPSTRSTQDQVLCGRIEEIHVASHGTYGAPRIHAEMAEGGMRVGRKRVARIMREKGIRGVSRRKWITTTVRDASATVAPDLVKRDFTAYGPNRLWVADITYVPTWARLRSSRATTFYILPCHIAVASGTVGSPRSPISIPTLSPKKNVPKSTASSMLANL
jgi:putative transposase